MTIRLKGMAGRRGMTAFLVVLFFAVLALLMYCVGKSHYVYADNSDFLLDGQTFKALDGAVICLDNRDELETYSGMRDELDGVMRQSHRLRVNFEGKTVERAFRIPIGENAVMISIPAFYHFPDNQRLWMSSFSQTDASLQLQVQDLQDAASEFDM